VRHDSSEIQPLILGHIVIDEDVEAGPPPGIYQGSIRLPHCIVNPNNFSVLASSGSEVYQVIRVPSPTLKLVASWGGQGREPFPARMWSDNFYSDHPVLVNESPNGTDYAIHVWSVIYNPDPIHRWDRWWNITFTPFATQSFFEEGPGCGESLGPR